MSGSFLRFLVRFLAEKLQFVTSGVSVFTALAALERKMLLKILVGLYIKGVNKY